MVIQLHSYFPNTKPAPGPRQASHGSSFTIGIPLYGSALLNNKYWSSKLIKQKTNKFYFNAPFNEPKSKFNHYAVNHVDHYVPKSITEEILCLSPYLLPPLTHFLPSFSTPLLKTTHAHVVHLSLPLPLFLFSRWAASAQPRSTAATAAAPPPPS